jgi:haloacetate dehalogenase
VFDGFDEDLIDVGPVRLFVRMGGDGPPVVLLHGHPRTSATWHRVAPKLVGAGYRVVCPDVRGYGRSDKPPTDAEHRPYSKRAAAGDIATLMAHLGHRQFAVVGHDRGSYVALRLALDHPDRVTALVEIDCIPITEHLTRADAKFATAWWHWFFFAQPDKPERAINADPIAWYRPDRTRMGEENYQEWAEAVGNPATVSAMLEDYRAGLTADRADEEHDRAVGRMLTCPTLVLWSTRDDLEDLYGDPLQIWRNWATDVDGHGIDSGHHVAEENPGALSAALIEFFDRRYRR